MFLLVCLHLFLLLFLLIMYPSGSQSQGQVPQEDKLLFSNMLLLLFFFFFTSFLLVLRHFTTSTSISKRQRFQRRRWRKDTFNISTNSSRYSRNIWYLLPLVPEPRVCVCVCVSVTGLLCVQVWMEFGRIKLPQGLHPNDLEEEWGKLILEMLEREKALRPAVDRCVSTHTHTLVFLPSSFSFLSASPSFSLSPPTGWSSFFNEPIRSRTCLWTVRRN